MMCCMLGLELGVHAQESVFLQQYREKVKAYFLPSLSGNANASYTGILPVSVRRPISPNVLPSSSGFFRRNSSKSRTPERSSQGQNEPFLNSRGLRADFIVKVNDIFQHGIPDSVILH